MFFKLERELKSNDIDYSKYFLEARIVSDRNTTGDTASIALAKSGKVSADTFKQGDTISLKAGYSRYGLSEEFAGIIVDAGPQGDTIELQCEDYFYQVRQKTLSRQFKKMALDKIVEEASGKEVIRQPGHAYPVITIGAWSKLSARAFISQLVKKYGYIASFVGSKLSLFKNNYTENDEYPEFYYGENIIENSLIYHKSEGVQCVNVVSENEYGYLVKSHYGTAGAANSRTFHLDGLSLQDANKRAKELFDEINFEGLRGFFKTIGYPYVRHSFIISIFPDGANGKRYDQIIDKVETTITSTDGFSRVIYPAKIIPEKKPVSKAKNPNTKKAMTETRVRDWSTPVNGWR